MVRKLAIDWDEIELRLVVAQCSGGSVKVTDAAVIPVENSNVVATLCSAIEQRGLEHSESLIAIGRGMAELRELQLPSVPAEELPDMVRFQAIRNFASAGESATVDYLVTSRDESGIGLIAAAVGPDKLTEIRNAGAAADLNIKRVSLRPLCAAALYLVNRDNESKSDTVLIDLLANDAEIVIAREGRVIFVRTVRMPATEATRGKALAGELRRSLVACGSTGSLERVVLWGRESVHADDVKMLAEASGSPVDVLDPFDVVGTDSKVKAGLPEHVGRLAPLVGLLVADECAPDRLIDFLNPRQRMEETTNPYRTALLVGVPVAIAVLLCFLLLSHLKGLDRQIAKLKTENENLKPGVDAALASIGRTNTVDDFLDGDVNWLDEIRRLATQMPPSDKLIVQSISGTSNARAGGGEFNVIGVVTNAGVIDDFEERLRDETHVVAGDGATELETQDGYRWEFDESITINAESIRNSRYAAMVPAPADAAAQDGSAEDAAAEDASAEDGSAEDGSAEDASAEDASAGDASAGDASAEDASAEESAPAEESPPPDEAPPEEASSDSDSEVESSEDEQPQPAELAADQSAEVQS